MTCPRCKRDLDVEAFPIRWRGRREKHCRACCDAIKKDDALTRWILADLGPRIFPPQ